MKLKSRKDTLLNLVVFGVLALVSGFVLLVMLEGEMAPEERWVFIPVTLIFSFILWMYFGTRYELSQNEFRYWYGPFNGKIKVSHIREVVKGKTVWVGFRPATARKGLIIK